MAFESITHSPPRERTPLREPAPTAPAEPAPVCVQLSTRVASWPMRARGRVSKSGAVTAMVGSPLLMVPAHAPSPGPAPAS